MTAKHWRWTRMAGGMMVLCVCATLAAYAQRPGGAASGTTRPYVPNGLIGDAVISADPDTKQITIIADEETADYIRQVIKGLDRPKAQVLIKVVFLEVTYNNSSDIGVEGSVTRKLASSVTGVASNIFGLAMTGASPVPPGAGIYTVLGTDLQATLRAIAQAGKSEVLSRPSILALNNQQATINLGQRVPLVTNTRFDTLGNQINTVTYQNVGIILQVTPFITSDGMVQMTVMPQTSVLADQSQWVPISSGSSGSVSAPVINSRSADTVVVVPDGQTVIIGGLMENNETSSDSKIPILGDLPLIGYLFKRQVKSVTKSELIIFLTPHIVNRPMELAGLSAKERANANLPSHAFSERELDRFLDTLPVKTNATDRAADKQSKAVPQATEIGK